MNTSVPDSAASSNPEKATPRVRVVLGNFMDQPTSGTQVFYLPETLSWEGPLNRAILSRAGEGLDHYILENLIKPRRGDVFVIPETVSPSPRLLLAILPDWDDGLGDEERLLKKCTRSIFDQAEASGATSLMFPALGVASRDIPHKRAARILLSVIGSYPFSGLREIVVVCKTVDIFNAYGG